MRINIVENIESEYAVSPEDGDKIYCRISEKISKKEIIVIDFEGVDIVTTAFLNNAIGRLYNEFNREQLNTYIKFENISENDLFLLKKVIERAKITYKTDLNNDSLKKLIKEEFGDE